MKEVHSPSSLSLHSSFFCFLTLSFCESLTGINVRHLGEVSRHVKDSKLPFSSECRWLLLVEMASRVLKQLYRQELRERMRALRIPLEQPYIQALTGFLNKTFANSKQGDYFWREVMKGQLVSKFGSIVFSEEEDQDLKVIILKRENELQEEFPSLSSSSSVGRSLNSKYLVFRRFQKMTRFELSKDVKKRLKNKPQSVFIHSKPFDTHDIRDLGDRIKHTNIISVAEGMYLIGKLFY
jgi:hypothetical protein